MRQAAGGAAGGRTGAGPSQGSGGALDLVWGVGLRGGCEALGGWGYGLGFGGWRLGAARHVFPEGLSPSELLASSEPGGRRGSNGHAE